MKTKIVLWGTNDNDKRVLIALELRAKDNKVDLYTFPENIVTEDFYNQMMDHWRNGKECEFPQGYHKEERQLSATDSLLPVHLKVERGDLIQRAQTEWHFVVLSSKLNEVYQSELKELKDKIEGLKKYEAETWDELKNFWAKVQSQIYDRNLFKEHADSLRQSTDALFDHLKKLRSNLEDELKSQSKPIYEKFMNTLAQVDEKVGKGLNLQSIFNELKKIQQDFIDSKLTKEHRSKVWNKLDKLFKTVKKKKYGSDAASGNSPMERLKRRYDGLLAAIQRMENSIKRDKDELAFQNRRIENSGGQLETQIRTAKLKMIEQRIASKNEKLEDMYKTKTELETKIAAQEERDRKRAEKEKQRLAKEVAKAAAKEKIAAQIAAQSPPVDEEKLKKAAAAIAASKTSKQAKPQKKQMAKDKGDDSLLAAISATLGEVFMDAVDTVKAVAEVVSDNIEDKIDELKEAADRETKGEVDAAKEEE